MTRPDPKVRASPESLGITGREAEATSAVAPHIGTTPRTVKRFVNTYRLLKARAFDASTFDVPRDGLGDHEVVAFLLALVTGHACFAARLTDEISADAKVSRFTYWASEVASWLSPHIIPARKGYRRL